MAFKWDLRQGCHTDFDVYGVNNARKIGFVSDFTPSDPGNAIDEALAYAVSQGAPAASAAYPGDSSGCQAVRRRIEPVDQNFVLFVDYERPGGAVTAGADTNKLYIVRESRTSVTVERSKLKHVYDGKPVFVGWKNPDDETQMIAPQLAELTLSKPVLEVTLAGTFNVKPTFTDGGSKLISTQAGKVNSTTFLGFPPGYWLFVGSETVKTPKQANRAFRASIINMLDNDWSQYKLVRHPEGNAPAPLNFEEADKPDDLYPLAAEKYVRPNTIPLQDAGGVVRVGVYEAIDFNAVFAALELGDWD